MRSNRFRRDAKALEDDEEMWFNEDDDEEGKAVVIPIEKSKTEDDFPDSYEKFMETKKGTKILNFHIVLTFLVKQSDSLSTTNARIPACLPTCLGKSGQGL